MLEKTNSNDYYLLVLESGLIVVYVNQPIFCFWVLFVFVFDKFYQYLPDIVKSYIHGEHIIFPEQIYRLQPVKPDHQTCLPVIHTH